MRVLRSTRANAVLLSTLLFPALISGEGGFDCSKVSADGQTFDLSKLGGPHSVMESTEQLPTFRNTTYTIDICKSLERPKSIPDSKKCPDGTRSMLWSLL